MGLSEMVNHSRINNAKSVVKDLTHSSKRNSEIIDIILVKYSHRINFLYYTDIAC